MIFGIVAWLCLQILILKMLILLRLACAHTYVYIFGHLTLKLIKSIWCLPFVFIRTRILCESIFNISGEAVAERLSSWLAEQEDRGSIPGLPTRILEIGYLLLSSRDMAERSLNRR